MATLAEQPCYTLINISSDAEPPTEMQLRTDLGKKIIDLVNLRFKGKLPFLVATS